MSLQLTVAPEDDRWADSRWRSRLRSQLIAWYSQAARDLPWRSDCTPYRVWVSEIMCQQTQVATVVPYFERFVHRYPSVSALAKSDSDELMRLWEGLGYYRRARGLRDAARVIVEKHGGVFPMAFDDVLALPGIGRYTAGAILSIADNQRHPILEGNTYRVFSRWVGLRAPVDQKPTQDFLWHFSETMLPRSVSNDAKGPATFNQAAMELGALVCSPNQPDCEACPVSRSCVARLRGWQNELPIKLGKTKYESRTEFAAVIRNQDGDLLLRRIPEGERFAGLWDVPRAGPPHAIDGPSFESWVASATGLAVDLGVRLKTIKHAVTKYRMTLHVHQFHARTPMETTGEGWQWVSADQWECMALSVTGRKIVHLLRDRQAQSLLPM